MLQRLTQLLRGMLGLAVTSAEKRHAGALLEREYENLREQISRYNQGLAGHAGLCEKLLREAARAEERENAAKKQIAMLLRQGLRDQAAQEALRLQGITGERNDIGRRLGEAENTYHDLMKTRDAAIAAARQRLVQIRDGLNDLKIRQAAAELNELAAASLAQLGGAGDALQRLQELVDHERSVVAGRARVARDVRAVGDPEVGAVEEKALAAQALADFAAAEGLSLDAPSPDSQPIPRTMNGR